MAEKERPGVMVYFDLRPCLKRLSLEDKGFLLEAILDYAQYGAPPELDGMAGVAWDFIRPRIDRDAERYEEIVENKRKAARKRWDKQEEVSQPDADVCSSMQVHADASSAMHTMPTTTTSSTTKTTSTPTSTSTSTPASTSTSAFTPIATPKTGWQNATNRQAVEEEIRFEALRQQKLKLLEQTFSHE